MRASATIVFDGDCNLCNATVNFVIANDPDGHFCFAASQSAAGRAMLSAAGRDPAAVGSIIVIDTDGLHERSAAALRVAAGLRRPWRSLRLLRVIPTRIRDPVYDWIARNHSRWLEKAERVQVVRRE